MPSILCNASLALTFLLTATAAWAGADDAGADYVQGYSEPVAPAPSIRYEFHPAQREAWLSDCHQKVAASRPRSGTVRAGQGDHGECESYLEDYLARYRQRQAALPGYAYIYPGQSRRMVSIPVVQAIDGKGEPIAYAEEPVVRPARRSIPRRDPASVEASSGVYTLRR